MENATKALIIAGAVLVSILLISIGVLLINNNKDITGAAANTSNAMSETASKGANKVNEILSELDLD